MVLNRSIDEDLFFIISLSVRVTNSQTLQTYFNYAKNILSQLQQ